MKRRSGKTCVYQNVRVEKDSATWRQGHARLRGGTSSQGQPGGRQELAANRRGGGFFPWAFSASGFKTTESPSRSALRRVWGAACTSYAGTRISPASLTSTIMRTPTLNDSRFIRKQVFVRQPPNHGALTHARIVPIFGQIPKAVIFISAGAEL